MPDLLAFAHDLTLARRALTVTPQLQSTAKGPEAEVRALGGGDADNRGLARPRKSGQEQVGLRPGRVPLVGEAVGAGRLVFRPCPEPPLRVHEAAEQIVVHVEEDVRVAEVADGVSVLAEEAVPLELAHPRDLVHAEGVAPRKKVRRVEARAASRMLREPSSHLLVVLAPVEVGVRDEPEGLALRPDAGVREGEGIAEVQPVLDDGRRDHDEPRPPLAQRWAARGARPAAARR